MILNFWPCQNYGALMTCYGVKCLMEKLGKKSKVINYFPKTVFRDRYSGSFTENFAEKYLDLTTNVRTLSGLQNLNKYADIFVAGSDQIWNQQIARTHHLNTSDGLYLLDFVSNAKKKLSYSASFGVDFFNGTEGEKNNFRHFLNRFDGISVREDSGVKIIENEFGHQAFQAIDGAFHIPAEKLAELCGDEKAPQEKYIGCYVLPYYTSNIWYTKRVEEISRSLDLPVKTLTFSPQTSVAEWLSFIRNAELVITDSYHATVLSIIFNRPFLQLVNNAQTQSRFDSLYTLLHINKPSLSQETIDLEPAELLSRFDWDLINDRLRREIEKAENWVKEVLDAPKKYNCNDDAIDQMIVDNKLRDQIINEKLILLANKRKIYFDYYRCKIFAQLALTSKKRTHYRFKKNILKSKINKIKELTNAKYI